MVAREEGILQKAQESPECPRGTAPHAAGAALGPAEPGLAQPHKPGGKCSGLKPGRRNGGGGGGGTPGANPGGGIPKGAVKAGGWSAPTTGGPDGWGGTWEKGRGKRGYPKSAQMILCPAGDLCLCPAPPGQLSNLKFLCNKGGLAQQI